MNNKDTDPEACFRAFYNALECKEEDEFFSRLTVENSHNLGRAFASAIKERLSERDRLKDVLKAARAHREAWHDLDAELSYAIDACADIEVEK